MEDEVDFVVDVIALIVGELRIQTFIHQKANARRRMVVACAHGKHEQAHA